mmetsp:Transcript_55675/g.162802  ORF Transcript_55675/g.162802 Transcript_55675/m.162802 type:complete len:206 (-) Transcript_55675:276-893(-)
MDAAPEEVALQDGNVHVVAKAGVGQRSRQLAHPRASMLDSCSRRQLEGGHHRPGRVEHKAPVHGMSPDQVSGIVINLDTTALRDRTRHWPMGAAWGAVLLGPLRHPAGKIPSRSLTIDDARLPSALSAARLQYLAAVSEASALRGPAVPPRIVARPGLSSGALHSARPHHATQLLCSDRIPTQVLDRPLYSLHRSALSKEVSGLW